MKKLPHLLQQTGQPERERLTPLPGFYYTTSDTIFQLVHPSILLEPLNLLVKRDGKVSYLTFLVLA